MEYSCMREWMYSYGSLCEIDASTNDVDELVQQIVPFVSNIAIKKSLAYDEIKSNIKQEMEENKSEIVEAEPRNASDSSAHNDDSNKNSRIKSDLSLKNSLTKGKGVDLPVASMSTLESALPTSTLPIDPFSVAWPFSYLSIPCGLACSLYDMWLSLEKLYIESCKSSLFWFRRGYKDIMAYLHQISTNFQAYVNRPNDLRYHIISFQKAFNCIPNALRSDVDLITELHQRSDDLKEFMWKITDDYKKENEKERQRYVDDKNLDEYLKLMLKHFAGLIEAEMNKLECIVQILKDVYASHDDRLLNELNVPHINLFNYQSSSFESLQETTTSQQVDKKKKSDSAEDKKKKQQATNTKREDIFKSDESCKSLSDLASYTYALMDKIASTEILEVEETLKTEKIKQNKPSKKNSSKHKGTVVKREESNDLTPEEMKIKFDRNIAHQEFNFAVNTEVENTKRRINLIHKVGVKFLQTLGHFKESTFEKMNDWIRRKYLDEMKTINEINELIKNCIECFIPLQNEILLQHSTFYIDEMSLFPLNQNKEVASEEILDLNFTTFTPCQLKKLYYQFTCVAPCGIISPYSFQQTVTNLLACEDFIEYFPRGWISKLTICVPYIASILLHDDEYLSWKKFLLLLSQPWPLPSVSDVIEALLEFCKLDQLRTNHISKEQLLKANIWLKMKKDPDRTDEQIDELLCFYFDLYAVESEYIQYIQFLFNFCLDDDHYLGFIKSLSVVLGQDLTSNPENDHCTQESSKSMDIDLLTLHSVMYPFSLYDSPVRFNENKKEILTLERIRHIYRDYDKEGNVADWFKLNKNVLLQHLLNQITAYKYYNLHDIVFSYNC